MKGKGSDVESWFSKAFPDYSVNILRVSSETIEYSNNVSKLSSLTRRNKYIDLVFCVDMFNNFNEKSSNVLILLDFFMISWYNSIN